MKKLGKVNKIINLGGGFSMQMQSIWSITSDMPSFKKLESDLNTDVLIIGGGIAGILCAYFLKELGVDYALVEGNTICSGITKNTTAKITSQHGLIYDKLLNNIGVDKAKVYLKVNESAVEKYREICRNIDCDFEEKDSYVYSRDNKEKIEKEIDALGKLGFNAEFKNQIPLPFEIEGAVKFGNQAQFNPLKFIQHISKGLNIYENTFIKSIEGTTATFDTGKISAKNIIVATHFPFINTHGSYFLKMYQNRSYVIALEGTPNIDGMYLDEKEKGLSFRTYKNLILIGGGSHRTGKEGGNWNDLREFARINYTDAKERYAWATQDCMTLDEIPYIGQYSMRTPNLYVATGFNKWGMTSSMVSAMLLVDMIMEKNNEYADVFSPHRSILKSQLLVNGFEATVNILNFSTKRCPHLGCALKWNNAEHSWDCPCHGSRFTEEGKIIDNPATGSIDLDK